MSLEHIKTILPQIINLKDLTANAELEDSSFMLPDVKNLSVKVIPLDYAISVYLPTKDILKISTLKEETAKTFRGYTSLGGEGGWLGKTGLIEEKMIWLRVFLNFESLIYLESFLEKVYKLAKDWEEESLLIEISNNTWTKRWLIEVL